MATSLIGPFWTDSALSAAPVPRPPQPTSASWIVLSSAGMDLGTTIAAKAVAAATRPVFFKNSRRERVLGVAWLMVSTLLFGVGGRGGWRDTSV